MAGIYKIDFSNAEIMTPDKTKVDSITTQPGWIWDQSITTVVGTDNCQARHLGIIQKGKLKVTHEDGSDVCLNSGDVYEIRQGHHAVVIGDIPCSMVEFNSEADAHVK